MCVVLCRRRPVVTSIINERSANKWGTPQGYQIQVQCPAVLLLSFKSIMCTSHPLHMPPACNCQVHGLDPGLNVVHK